MTPWGWSDERRWRRQCLQRVFWSSTPLMSSQEVSLPPGESLSLEKKCETGKGKGKEKVSEKYILLQ